MRLKWLTRIVLVGIIALAWSGPLIAQSGVTISPAQISIAAVRGQLVARTLLLRTSEPLVGLRVVSLDLVGAKGDEVLPAEVIGVDLPTVNIAAGDLVTIPVNFDLQQAPCGAFTGELLLSYEGGSLAVPVSVAVKDLPWLPLGALVVGVALGIGVSNYRARGRPRDEILVQLGQIRTQMKVDKDLEGLGRPFFERVEAELVDVEVALEGQRWEVARQAAGRAEQVWLTWRRSRPDWLEQLKYYQALSEKLAAMSAPSFYLQEVRQAARDALRTIPDMLDPQEFRKKLELLTAQINRFEALEMRLTALAQVGEGKGAAPAAILRRKLYALDPDEESAYTQLAAEIEASFTHARKLALQTQIVKMEKMGADLSETEQADWSAKVAEFKQALAELTPEDEGGYLALQSAVAAAIDAIRPNPNESFTAKGPQEMPPLLAGLPAIQVKPTAAKIVDARRRLRWFTWLTYSVAVVSLALAGFMELYAARPDFGANGIGDYFTLLAWGFGAEATRSAVADMVQGWGVTGSK
ncbi:MAG TPA: hypothetical protein PKH77_19480 [Anaerolineae bacterium]|nr:hypothetical protein [Anaerolineae bacterium]